jgi:HAD superfamily hydrolase (TIGR01549 family)
MTVRAVLFDAGDTLIRLRARSGALLLAAARQCGVTVDPAAARVVWRRVLAGASTPEELAKGRDLSPHRHREVWTGLYARSGADRLAAGLSDALYDLTVDPRSWEAFSDTAATLRGLHDRGVPVGVVSDTGVDLRPVLDRLGLTRWIEAVALSCDSGVCKPDARVFHDACEQLGVPPAATLMVGDNPLTDGGAAGAGLLVLLLPPPSPAGPRGLDPVLALAGGASA